MTERDPFQRYRERLAAIGFRPSSTRGQNFLLDPSLHRWIAEQAAPGPADTVVEIGAGLGFLTRELAQRAGRMVAVELDDRLLAIARDELGALSVEWIGGDALGGPGHTLHPALLAALAAPPPGDGGRRLVVANLPYSVSGPLLAELTAASPWIDTAVLLVQKELAQRAAAGPGDPDYGGLSVAVRAAFTASSLRDVPPEVFRPRPKVTSAVLRLDRRPDGLAAGTTEVARREFLLFVRHLFRQRRKVLRTTLPAAAAAIGATAPALDPRVLAARAEAIDPDTIVGWWRAGRPS